MTIQVLNGANLGRLGTREPTIYGDTTYAQLVEVIEKTAHELQQDVQVRVEPVLAVGDFQSANGALDAQELAEVLPCPAGGGASPGVTDLHQERGQIIAETVRTEAFASARKRAPSSRESAA